MWYEKEAISGPAEISNDFALSIPRHLFTRGRRFFLTIWLKFRKQSNRKYISRVRRQLEKWERYRIWMILLNIILLALAISIVPIALLNFEGFIDPKNVSFEWFGFFFGAIIGYLCGSMLHKAVHSLLTSLFMCRAEKLMLKYHDAILEAVALEKYEDDKTNFDFKENQ